MAETAITAVLSKFGELASREAAVLLQVGNDIMLLRDRLEWLQAFIRDADRKRRLGADDFTRVWVRQTRDVAFQAEDALDDFFHKVDLESQGYRGWKIWGRYFTSCITQITVRHGLSGRIKIIKGRLDQMSENHKEYKIEHTPSGAWTSSFTEVAAWDNLTRNKLVGFEGYLNTLMSQLLADKDFPHQAFFSILGESGIGKETLIREICNHVDEKNHFHIGPIWCNMPPNSSTEGVLEHVYNKVLKGINAVNAVDSQQKGINIAEELHRLLHNKRYLVILGGISSKNILNCVAASLPDDKNGSRVVLILEPEDEEVARHADILNKKGHDDTLNSKGHATTTTINSTIQLSRLDKEKSGELFCWKVFGDKPSAGRSVGTNHILNVQNNKQKQIKGNKPEEIKNVETSYDQDVFDITGGHPLAIVVLSGLLRSKEKPVEWDAVLRQLKPGVEDEDSQGNRMTGVLLSKEKNVEWDALLQQLNPAREAKLSNRMSIERIFSTSFDDLPHDLKSCFLYFAAYPKNLTHPADQIVRMWMAEGFIKPQKGKTIEKLGRDYLKELVSRCLVEIEQTNDNGDIVLVRVHNRLLGFLQSEAQEASFIEIHDKNDVLAPAAVRRLSIQNDSGSYTTSNNTFPKLRSFICRVSGETPRCGGASTDKKNSSGHKLLCMMPGWIGEGGHSSSTNAKHKHNITSKHDFKFLCGSKFLRVISIHVLGLNELPEEIGDMIHLRYLCVACDDLEKLPYSIERLLNLQTLDIRKTQVKQINPKFWKIQSLRHVLAEKLMLSKLVITEPDELQTLHGVEPATETWDEGSCPLDKLIKLRSLELHGFVAVRHGKALASALENMHLLDHLKLKGTEIPSCVFTAPGLHSLQTLVLDGNVIWQKLTSDVRKLRPNLITVQVRDLNEMPPEYRAGLPYLCRVERIPLL